MRMREGVCENGRRVIFIRNAALLLDIDRSLALDIYTKTYAQDGREGEKKTDQSRNSAMAK